VFAAMTVEQKTTWNLGVGKRRTVDYTYLKQEVTQGTLSVHPGGVEGLMNREGKNRMWMG